MRRDYTERDPFLETDLAADWVGQFADWFAAAVAAGLPEPNAMIVGTATRDGRPSARTVLLKGYDVRGFVFYTNYESRKGTEAAENAYASLVFPWFPMQRQVIVAGAVERVSRAETEEYFASRPRGSQLGAWASPQSRVLADRAAVEAGLAAGGERFADGPVPAPPHWGGLRVVPETIEFWQGRANRLHDRLRYQRSGAGEWVGERLRPLRGRPASHTRRRQRPARVARLPPAHDRRDRHRPGDAGGPRRAALPGLRAHAVAVPDRSARTSRPRPARARVTRGRRARGPLRPPPAAPPHPAGARSGRRGPGRCGVRGGARRVDRSSSS